MDRPIEEIAALADEQIKKGFTIWMKWTCPSCGSRQTMDEPNLLYRSGICQACGETNDITVCGFMLANDLAAPLVEQSVRDA
jgi:hypothetical protein